MGVDPTRMVGDKTRASLTLQQAVEATAICGTCLPGTRVVRQLPTSSQRLESGSEIIAAMLWRSHEMARIRRASKNRASQLPAPLTVDGGQRRICFIALVLQENMQGPRA